MKKIIIVMLALLTVFTMVSCGNKAEVEEKEEMLVGGWTEKDEKLTDEELQIFEDAVQWVTDVTLEPVRLIGTQVVAGLNYRFLCKETSESGQTDVVVTIYHDLQGNNTVTSIENYND